LKLTRRSAGGAFTISVPWSIELVPAQLVKTEQAVQQFHQAEIRASSAWFRTRAASPAHAIDPENVHLAGNRSHFKWASVGQREVLLD